MQYANHQNHGRANTPMTQATSDNFPRIALAMGDPAGISPELLARLLSRSDLMQRAAGAVIGDRRVLAAGETVAGLQADLAEAGDIDQAAPGKPVFIDLGHLDPASIPMK